ncbi:carboxylesterase [Hysterangium stoloniferum]|nr:carboxylesterase [Hysterangium stoloniferum]
MSPHTREKNTFGRYRLDHSNAARIVDGTLVTPKVRQFLGVPFAVVARWEPPETPPTRSTILEATAFGDSCIQDISKIYAEFLLLIGGRNQKVIQSEQCLSLNIWAPSLDRKQSTAVMIWMYGGGYAFGTSNTIVYEGQELVGNNDDVLLVTVNYRTNIFGFPGAPQLSSKKQSQNFGALDVDAAIQWVHDNIDSFGGNTERITIFGQSAGSGLAAAYTFPNPTDTRVKGVIQESGRNSNEESLAGLTTALTVFGGPLDPSQWNGVADEVGCGSSATAAQLTCMNAVSATALEAAVAKTGNGFVPVQDDATERSAAGNFLRVPLLVGNTKQEGDIFVVAVEQLDLGFDIPGLTTLGSDAVTKIILSCPAGTTAKDHAKVAQLGDIDMMVLLTFPSFAIIPDVDILSQPSFPTSPIGQIYVPSMHQNPLWSSEHIMLHHSDRRPPLKSRFSTYVQGAWVSFARDPQRGLVNYGWPLYNPDTNSLALLGSSDNQTGVVFSSGSSYDSGCGQSELAGAIAIKVVQRLRSIF